MESVEVRFKKLRHIYLEPLWKIIRIANDFCYKISLSNVIIIDLIWYDIMYLLTAIKLTPGGSSTVHIYLQTIHRTTQ